MNSYKLIETAKAMISDLDIYPITNISFSTTDYGDGEKQLSIEIGYLEEETRNEIML